MKKDAKYSRCKVNGRPVIDGTEALYLQIKQIDVEKAARQKHDCCVIAQAVQRQCRTEALVYRSRVYLKVPDQDLYERYVIGRRLQQELVAFDRGGEFFEGDYTLKIIPDTRRFGAKKKTGPKKKRGKKWKKPVSIPGIRATAMANSA